VSFHDDLILNWAFSDTVTQRSNIDLWLAELEQWRARAEAAEANARQWEQTAREYSRVQEHTKTRAEAAEAALAAVPVEALVRWHRFGIDERNYSAQWEREDENAIAAWVARQIGGAAVSDKQPAAKLQTANEADFQDAHRQIEKLRTELDKLRKGEESAVYKILQTAYDEIATLATK